MKKLFALMLAAGLALSLVACGGGDGTGDTNTPSDTPSGGNGDVTNTDTPSGGGEDSTTEPTMTKEEIIEQATKVSIIDIHNAMMDNKLRAKEQYCNTPILVDGKILEIEDDHIVLVNGGSMLETLIDVYLPTDDLIKLSTNQRVLIAGINSDFEERSDSWGGSPWNTTHYIMDTAYIADTKFEITGTLNEVNGKFSVKKVNGDGSIMHDITFADGIDKELYYGKEITVYGEMIYKTNGFLDILDAEIIE